MSMLLHKLLRLMCLVLIIAELIHGQSTDMEVLVQLKNFLLSHNLVNRGEYDGWLESEASPCNWRGVGCAPDGHVNSLDLSNSSIYGPVFSNFSRLKGLTHLNLSENSITGELPDDLNRCLGLQHLNLSHNLIGGVLNISSLSNLKSLDVSQNRFEGKISMNFPGICRSLAVLDLSSNNLTGVIDGLFNDCMKLEYVDLSFNRFTGEVWQSISGLTHFSAAENRLIGNISSSMFLAGCRLQFLDLSSNLLYGNFPNSIAKCSALEYLSLSDNGFQGTIPPGIGTITGLEKLILGSNHFDRNIPLELTNCTRLNYLDISNNNFGGDVQGILGKLASLRNLKLHSNKYTGGIESSGLFRLPELTMIDLSLNWFTGELPTDVASMRNIKCLVLAENKFSGQIPPAYGQLVQLQVLDLSYNNLSGEIPGDIGNLTSLLVLMLARNQLSGEIPREIGNCTSLVWLNLAGNKLSGQIPQEIAGAGRNPGPTFAMNRNATGRLEVGINNCLALKRWIPLGYPGFNFVDSEISWKNCYNLENLILRGYVILHPYSVRPCLVLGYVQLSGNQLSGKIPPKIAAMKNFNLLLLDDNRLFGALPGEIAQLPLVAFNISRNFLSGEIPSEIGKLVLLENLDLSFNNFSNELPTSLNQLHKLSSFNVSYNPLLSGNIPSTGQISTFDEQSFLGDPLLLSVHFPTNELRSESTGDNFSSLSTKMQPTKEEIMVSTIAFIVFFFTTIAIREHDNLMYVYEFIKCNKC